MIPAPGSFIEINKQTEQPEFRIFSDPTIPAFFIAASKPLKVVPQKNQVGRVEFLVTGIGIDEALKELYADTNVGVMTYIRALKGLRSSIFALKGEQTAARG